MNRMSGNEMASPGLSLAPRATIVICLSALLYVAALSGCGESSAGSPLDKAKAHIEEREYAAAIIELKNALQQDSMNVEARWLLAENYLLFGEGLNAEKALARMESGRDRDPAFRAALAQSLILQGRVDEAVAESEIADGDEVSAQLLAYRAIALTGTRAYEEAQEVVARAAELAPSDPVVFMARGVVAFALDDAEKAIEFVRRAEESAAIGAEPYLIHGRIEQARGNYAEAEAAFRRADDVGPRRIDVNLGLAQALVAQAKSAEAIKVLNPLLLRDPELRAALLFRAQANLQLEQREPARDDLRLLVGTNPNYLPGRLMLGQVLLADGRYEQAEDMIAPVVARHPEHEKARALLAEILVRNEQSDAAIALMTEQAAGTNDPKTLEFLGSLYGRAGRVNEGIRYLRESAELDPANPSAKLKLALAEIAAGNLDKAAIELGSIENRPHLERQVDSIQLLLSIEEGKFAEAVKQAEALVAADEDASWARFMLGNAYLGSGDVDKARAAFLDVVEQNPAFTSAMTRLADLELQTGNREAAAEWFEKAVAIAPGDETIIIPLAVIRSQQGKFAEATALLERLRDKYPTASAPRLALAQLYIGQDDYDNALKAVMEAAALEPGNRRVELTLVVAYLGLNDGAKALEVLERPGLAKLEGPEINLLRAAAQTKLGATGKARDILARSLESSPDDFATLVNYTKAQSRLGDVDGATKTTLLLQSKHPDAPAGYVLYGDIQAMSGNDKAADEAFQRAIELGAGIQVGIRRFKLLYRDGKKEEALGVLREWAQRAESRPYERYALAVALQQAGESAEAIAVYEAMAADGLVHPSAMNNLAWLYYETRDGRAIEVAERAHQLAPDNPGISDTLGWIMVNQGQAALALKHLRDAVDGSPDSPLVRYHLGVALARSGDMRAAKQMLESALALGEFAEKAKAKRLYDTL